VQVVDPGDWFRVAALGDGLTRIEEPYVDELVSANIWHLRGSERDLVVDSGLGVASLRTALPWLFEHDPVLVLTHAHLDHLGGANEFADVRVHGAELDEVRRPGPVSLVTRTELELLGLGDEYSPDEVPPELLLKALPSADYDVGSYALQAVPPAVAVSEGDLIDLGDRRFTVLHLPGHTPGSLSLHEVATGVLFTGDVLYEGGLIDSCIGSDVPAYRATMQRLLDLEVTRVYAGHGRVLDRSELRAVVSDYLAMTEKGGHPGP